MQTGPARCVCRPSAGGRRDLEPHASAPAKRFAVYRNNVVVSLIDALATRFPAVQRIVGEEFFRAMAGVRAGASAALALDDGLWRDLPAFVETFAPAAELPYLADVAHSKQRARAPSMPPTRAAAARGFLGP